MKDLLIHCDVARPLEQCSLDIWDSLGAALYYANIIVWLDKLVQEALLRCLESHAGLFDVVGVEGKGQLYV